jgi:hypothetical protein
VVAERLPGTSDERTPLLGHLVVYPMKEVAPGSVNTRTGRQSQRGPDRRTGDFGGSGWDLSVGWAGGQTKAIPGRRTDKSSAPARSALGLLGVLTWLGRRHPGPVSPRLTGWRMLRPSWTSRPSRMTVAGLPIRQHVANVQRSFSSGEAGKAAISRCIWSKSSPRSAMSSSRSPARCLRNRASM